MSDDVDYDLAADLRSPATCYWWRSHVLLPLELVPHLDSDQLEDVLRHELFHVRQHDYLWDRLAALGCRVVFFHPLVWLAYRHLRWERELACDYAVVRESSEARLRYARVSYQPRPLVHGEKNVFAGNNFFFVRILAQSQSSGRSERTLDLLSFSRSCPGRTCLHCRKCCVVIAARPGTISVFTDSSDQLFGATWQCPFILRSKEKGRGQSCAFFHAQDINNGNTSKLRPQSGAEGSIKSLLDIPPAALPLLKSSTAGEDTAATRSTSCQ